MLERKRIPPEQEVSDLLRMMSRGDDDAALIRHVCESAGDPDEEHAREHLRLVLEGYEMGFYFGSMLIGFAGASVSGPPLYLIAAERGYRAGVRYKILFKIVPICVLVALAIVLYKIWW